MGKVVAAAVMSLDGYVAKQDNTIGRLFDWYQNGDVECRTASPDITMHISRKSVEHWRTWISSIGALVCGRTLFDFTNGWDGRHTLDVPVIVVTHQRSDGLDAGPSRCTVHLRHRWGATSRRTSPSDRRRAKRCGDGRGHCSTVPRTRPTRRGGYRPRTRRHGRGPTVLRQARWRRCPARRPNGVHPRRPGHPPRFPSKAMSAVSRAVPAVKGFG